MLDPRSDGGLANTWDYGPLGVELKNNVKKAWWDAFIRTSPYNVGMDSAILMNPEVWVATGHVGNFDDPLMDCKACKSRFRADKLIEDYMFENGLTPEKPIDGWTNAEMEKYIETKRILSVHSVVSMTSPRIRQFNLMFKTFQGVTEDWRRLLSTRVLRRHRAFSSISRMCSAPPARRFRLASDRSARVFPQ